MRILRFVALIALLSTFGSCKPSISHPNILLITVDTLRLDHLGCYGSKEVKTPNIDSIAAGSVLFENYFTTANVTFPAHFSIFSGRDPARYGYYENAKYAVPPNVRLLPGFLKQEGYRTYGITSIFFMARIWMKNFGDQFESYVSPPAETEWNATEVTAQFRRILPGLQQQPFFLWLHYYDPHAPYDPPFEYQKKYDAFTDRGDLLPEEFPNPQSNWVKEKGIHRTWIPEALYRGEISYVDSEIGKVMDLLRANSLWDNTMVVIVADHGECLGERGFWYLHNGLYNQTMHVPFFIHAPHLNPRRIKSYVSAIDVLPTVLELAHIRIPPGLEGVSLSPLLNGKEQKMHNALYGHHWDNQQTSILKPPYKMIVNTEENGDVKNYELYDIVRDPLEKQNILASMGTVTVDKMKNLAQQKLRPPSDAREPVGLTEEEERVLRSLGYVN